MFVVPTFSHCILVEASARPHGGRPHTLAGAATGGARARQPQRAAPGRCSARARARSRRVQRRLCADAWRAHRLYDLPPRQRSSWCMPAAAAASEARRSAGGARRSGRGRGGGAPATDARGFPARALLGGGGKAGAATGAPFWSRSAAATRAAAGAAGVHASSWQQRRQQAAQAGRGAQPRAWACVVPTASPPLGA